jgi:hypothetical protein
MPALSTSTLEYLAELCRYTRCKPREHDNIFPSKPCKGDRFLEFTTLYRDYMENGSLLLHNHQRLFPSLLLACFLALASCAPATTVTGAGVPADSVVYGDLLLRTELYFGMSKPKGGEVSEAEWKRFLDSVITPRFPDGLSVFDTRGQWRGNDGQIVLERTKMVMLIHPLAEQTNAAIEEIRSAYRQMFEQESVMRITSYVRVRF